MSPDKYGKYSKCQVPNCKYFAKYQVNVPMRYEIENAAQGKISLCSRHRKQYNELSITQKTLFRIVPHSRETVKDPGILDDFTHHRPLYQKDYMKIPGK